MRVHSVVLLESFLLNQHRPGKESQDAPYISPGVNEWRKLYPLYHEPIKTLIEFPV